MMASLAIFIDGGYLDVVCRKGGVKPDNHKLSELIHEHVAASTAGPVDLLRTYYYTCPPYQNNRPTDDDRRRYSEHQGWVTKLRRLPRYEVREGKLIRRYAEGGVYREEQKRVDVLLGLDFASACSTGRVTHVALLTGDSDLIPAVQLAKQESVAVWLFHGTDLSGSGDDYHHELWTEADERVAMDRVFLDRIRRPEAAAGRA